MPAKSRERKSIDRTWLILDSNYLCHRAWYVFGGKLSYEEKPTGVLFGFLKMIETMKEYYNTEDLIFCWDSKSSKRKKIYPQYKANRQDRDFTPEEQKAYNDFRKQIELLRTKFLPLMGYKNSFYQEGYEADDLIASICQQNHSRFKNTDRVVIVTSDKDLYQLIRSNIFCYNPQTNITMTLQRFYSEYKIHPKKWWQVKAIAGCSTDNVKGVEGVGEKTAIKYLNGELKPTTKAYENIKLYEENNLDVINVPLVKLPFKGTMKCTIRQNNFNQKVWNQICNSLGMNSLEV